ncbi:MAG: GDP-L-fucose synthase [Flavobacteriales bacterium]|nr:GDP-L-fucose synthase [Flavobacteriales bacterium]
MDNNSKIYVAGHTGMVGSAICRDLEDRGFSNLLLRKSSELDLTDQALVHKFFADERPEYVFLAAAKVGGIRANDVFRAEFIYSNLVIQCNIIQASHLQGVKKLLFLGSSCIYPKYADQPLKEEYLLTGELEPTNEMYAIAKIAGLKMCEAYRSQYGCNFISVMPTNLYGTNDNYDLQNSHVLPALLRKIHQAKLNNDPSVEVWGTGKPRREFMHVSDLSKACLFLMQEYNDAGVLNVGTGEDISIGELASLIREVVGYEGEIVYDSTKPDGTPRKLLDVSKLNALGWKHEIGLREGISRVYEEVLGLELFV